MRPIPGKLRRALLRKGLQQERLARLKIGRSRVRKLLRGIERGELRVLASKEQRAWGKYDQDLEGMGHVVGHILETGRDVAGKRSRRGRGETEAMWATAPYAVGKCVWCHERSDHEHAVRCSEWRPEVRQAEEQAAAAMLGHGGVGRIWGWVGEGPSWRSERGWAVEDGEWTEGSLGEELGGHGRLDAAEWGALGKGAYAEERRVKVAAELMQATAAHMCEGSEHRNEGGKTARQRGAQMARAACLVPSLWKTTGTQQDRALRLLVEWATLERVRPYPIEVVGSEQEKGSVEEEPEWQRKHLRMRVQAG
jgi:hypothetical protein